MTQHFSKALLQTIKEWPHEIYDIVAVIVTVCAKLDTTVKRQQGHTMLQ